MRLTINAKEYDAINFAIDQIEAELESADDDEWCELAQTSLRCLYGICKKYKAERAKANEFNRVRNYIRSANPECSTRHIDKLTRLLIRKRNGDGQ